MQRKHHSAEFKTKVALEAIKGLKTVNEIARELGVHPSQIALWKRQALEALPDAFSSRKSQAGKGQDSLTAELYQQIGQLKVELDWLKKNLDLPLDAKRRMVEPTQTDISIARQCELLGLARSSFYYEAAGENATNERLMQLLDRQFTQTPFYGVRRMTAWLQQQGEVINPKRVRRLMRIMGLEAKLSWTKIRPGRFRFSDLSQTKSQPPPRPCPALPLSAARVSYHSP